VELGREKQNQEGGGKLKKMMKEGGKERIAVDI
jgi:hypothetical protein